MIHVFGATNLQLLANELAEKLKNKEPASDPFISDWIVVQNKETQSWLQAKISEINGISANLKFVLPSELGWQILRLYRPNFSTDLPTDRITIQARLIDLLITRKSELQKFGLQFPDVPTMVVSLSQSISDVFDLYQVFRPEQLKKWTEGLIQGKNTEAWQSYLWNELTHDISAEYPDIPNRYKLPDLISDSIALNPEILPKQLFVFGLSHWSKPFFDTICALSNQMHIHWFDQTIQKKILKGAKLYDWARPKIEVQDFFKTSEYIVTHSENPITSDLTLPENKKIHSCHSAEREVQVLKNELLHALDRNKNLSVDDVLIMVPDFEKYAPIIDYEFNTRSPFTSIPVHVSDNYHDASTEFLLSLINLYQSGEKITDFLELLNHPSLKHAFEIDESEIRFYEKAFAEMNIHFGFSKKEAAFSIEQGVEQLLLSYSMLLEKYNTYGDNALIDLRSGSDSKKYIGKLAHIHRLLHSFKVELNKTDTLLIWLNKIEVLLGSLISEQAAVFRTIVRLRRQLELSNMVSKIPFEAFHLWLQTNLNDQSASSTRMGTGVTISSYIPYRNIPYKFVAILGLNEGVFPRKVHRPEFDLIHTSPKPGDRITKLDDELLFFERIHATEDHLHLSYIGEGAQGSMPSTLIQELMDMNPNIPHVKHRLHAFSKDSLLQAPNYATQETVLSTLIHSKQLKNPDTFAGDLQSNVNEEVNVQDFIQYFAHPSKHLLANVLGLKNIYEEVQPTDRESYILSGLGKYQLKHDLVNFFRQSADFKQFQKHALIKGSIPRGVVGKHQLEEQKTLVEEVQFHVKEYVQLEESMWNVRSQIEDKTLLGSIDGLYGDERVQWKISELKPKDILQLWIAHLLLSHENKTYNRSLLVGFNQKKEVVQYEFIKQGDALDVLVTLLEFYTQSNATKHHWSCIPSLAHTFISYITEPEKQEREISKAWYSNNFKFNEDADFYNQTLWQEELPWQNHQFGELAHKIWSPLNHHLKVRVL